jgi:hypothetical protein
MENRDTFVKSLGYLPQTVIILPLVLGVALIALIASSPKEEADTLHVTVTINGESVIAEVAQTAEEREKGLSGRASLGKNEGMLFVFPEPTYPSFWMKGMLFPIDIIWLNDAYVVDVTKNLPLPEGGDDYKTYEPQLPVTYVLEVPAGWADKHDIAEGMPYRIER